MKLGLVSKNCLAFLSRADSFPPYVGDRGTPGTLSQRP